MKTSPTVRAAKERFDEARRALVHERVQLANAESEFALALSAYLAVLSARVLEPTT
jgi:hypothetical protein